MSAAFPVEDGTAFGTVGGAGLEEKTKALARQCLSEKLSSRDHFLHRLATVSGGADGSPRG